MAAPEIPDDRPVTASRENTSARPDGSENSQLLPTNGVNKDVSSVAIDRRVLAGGRSPQGYSTSSVSAVGSWEAMSDVDVMLRVKTGDESAFSYLVQKYRRPMVGFMYRLCHNPSAAEELAQEVFLRVYRSRTSYEPSAKFTTWLYPVSY